MGVLPLQFQAGESADSLGLDGTEEYAIEGLAAGLAAGFQKGREVTVKATGAGGEKSFGATVRLDTPNEARYFQHGGILQYVLRQLLGG